ncbi:MAG: T9SS type A sorting domain-containing protein [Vicingaceae bacterium]
MKLLLSITLFISTFLIQAQQTKKALFIGNSYTAYNNLPQLVANMAQSTGDSLIFDSHTPGGNRFLHHAANATVMNKIFSNDWDFVSLQGQSQEVAFDSATFYQDVYPNVKLLCDTIRSNNECSQPLFYTTWGRQNGDNLNCAFLPYMCTYQGMDSALTANYTLLAQDNQTEMSPVGPVWNYIRTHHPNINLYAADGSHPSAAGSYAAACTFYTLIFKKDPTLINWNYNLATAVSDTIKRAAKRIAYDSLAKWDFSLKYPKASFTILPQTGNQLQFKLDTLSRIDSVRWDFGDGATSSTYNPIHPYASGGTYQIQLKVYNCSKVDSLSQSHTFILNGLEDEFQNNQLLVYPNPVKDYLQIVSPNGNQKSLEIRLFNTSGKLLHRFQAKEEINLSAFKNGIYFIEVFSNGRLLSRQKLIKVD